jgi:hypothetical protein
LKEKRHVSAPQVLYDIHCGMDDKALMKKYRISPNGLKRMFDKLIGYGFMTEEERAEFEFLWAQKNGRIWRCPACHMPQSHEFEECPQCGVIISKFLAKGPHEEETAAQECEFEFVDSPSEQGACPARDSSASEDRLSGATSDLRRPTCPACQAVLTPDAKFCTACGAPVK